MSNSGLLPCYDVEILFTYARAHYPATDLIEILQNMR